MRNLIIVAAILLTFAMGFALGAKVQLDHEVSKPVKLVIGEADAIGIVNDTGERVGYFEWTEPGAFEVRVIPKRERPMK